MLIEEVIRTCASRPVAEAAVLSVGGGLASDVRFAAEARGMSIGDFTANAVDRFAQNGRENEMRAVASAMRRSQEPVLAALERILWMRLDGMDGPRRSDIRTPSRRPCGDRRERT